MHVGQVSAKRPFIHRSQNFALQQLAFKEVSFTVWQTSKKTCFSLIQVPLNQWTKIAGAVLFFTACPELIYFSRYRLVCVVYVRFKSWSWTLALSLPVLYDLFQDISALFYHWKEVLHYLNLSHDLGFINTNAWKPSRTGELADSSCPHFSWTTVESDLFSRCFWRSAAISSADLGMEVWKNSSIHNRLTASLKSLIPSHKMKWSLLFITLLFVVDRVYILYYISSVSVRYSPMHPKTFFFHVSNQWLGTWMSWGHAGEALLCSWNLVIQKYSMNKIKASSWIW